MPCHFAPSDSSALARATRRMSCPVSIAAVLGGCDHLGSRGGQRRTGDQKIQPGPMFCSSRSRRQSRGPRQPSADSASAPSATRADARAARNSLSGASERRASLPVKAPRAARKRIGLREWSAPCSVTAEASTPGSSPVHSSVRGGAWSCSWSVRARPMVTRIPKRSRSASSVTTWLSSGPIWSSVSWWKPSLR